MIEFHILSSFKRLMDSTYQFHRVLRCIDKQNRSSEQNNRIQSRESCCRWECTSHCANTAATCKACFRTGYRCTLPCTHSGNRPVRSRICHRVDTWRFCSGRCGFHTTVLKVSKIRAGNVFLSHLTTPYFTVPQDILSHATTIPFCTIPTMSEYNALWNLPYYTFFFEVTTIINIIWYHNTHHTVFSTPHHTIPSVPHCTIPHTTTYHMIPNYSLYILYHTFITQGTPAREIANLINARRII